ncbi:MAG: ABC transporter substrate-binding protein [Marinomonas sp.]
MSYPIIFTLVCLILSLSLPSISYADSKIPLRVLTWEGYVTEEELAEVNQTLEQRGYNYEAQVITPYSEGAEQMFAQIRAHQVDVAFLTLFFIKMDLEQTSKLLQPINIHSPRLNNYKHLLPTLTHLPMGLNTSKQPLYIPWGGGTYGFYIDRNKVSKADVPTSIKELWQGRWKGRYSLNKSQEWYNIGLSLMSLDKSPFFIYEAVQTGNLDEINQEKKILEEQLVQLYANAGDFWRISPEFKEGLHIISSWGPEIARENAKGANWQMIHFKEGQMAWLDTINFTKEVSGRKLEAAEIFANFFIGKKVQSRITQKLSMVAASSEVTPNPNLGDPSQVFKAEMFVPPYDKISYDIMERFVEKANHHIKYHDLD